MKRVIICGGGVIGAAVAFYLSRGGARAVVLERHEVAGAASGKSGGFLARDWCRGSALDPLAQRSFDLHAGLAETLGNPWGHRRVETWAGYADAGGRVARTQRLGSPRTTAVIEPRAFTTGLMRAAEAAGAELRKGAVAGLARNAHGAVAGVVLESGETIEGDAVVIALGPWSLAAASWLPIAPVYGMKGHSLVLETGSGTPAEALFLEYREAGGEILSAEIFPRADGTTWVCAISSESTVPVDPAAVAPDAGAHERLEAMCRVILPALAAAPVRARQACYRPVTEDGLPLIGAVPGVANPFVATGHSVWGMLNAPATGEAMAQLILDGRAAHIDLAPFAPAR